MYQLLLTFSAWAEVRLEAGEGQQEVLPFQTKIWDLYSQSLVESIVRCLLSCGFLLLNINPVDNFFSVSMPTLAYTL